MKRMKRLGKCFLAVSMICAMCACSSDKEQEELEVEEEKAAEVEKPEEEQVQTQPAQSTQTTADPNGIRPEFKSAMDSYEAFYDDYVEFLKRYEANPTDLSLITEYSTMMTRLEEMDAAFEQWDDEDLNSAELAYYLEVNNRVMQKLASVGE